MQLREEVLAFYEKRKVFVDSLRCLIESHKDFLTDSEHKVVEDHFCYVLEQIPREPFVKNEFHNEIEKMKLETRFNKEFFEITTEEMSEEEFEAIGEYVDCEYIRNQKQ